MNGCCMGMAMGNAHDDDCYWVTRGAHDTREVARMSADTDTLAALRMRVDKLADLAAEHMGCSGCPTPWWLVNWLSEEASARVIPPGSGTSGGAS